jgi:hypothetical protein
VLLREICYRIAQYEVAVRRTVVPEDSNALGLEIARIARPNDGVLVPGHAGDDGVSKAPRAGVAQPAT